MSEQTNEARPDGIDIEWIGGNCPVQAEGTFDGVSFYFRARGTSVTVDVGDGAEAWGWRGPEYEWPDAGWIAEDTARAFIAEAYAAWTRRAASRGQRTRRRENDGRDVGMRYISLAAELKRAGVTADAVDAYLMRRANECFNRPDKGADQ